jgi:glyoxalase family protein
MNHAHAISGIHHVTAIATDPQANVDFYSQVLGLRLVKRTVNFDDPGAYHLYFGDTPGRPGTIMTFFPWPGARRGRRGVGQATVTGFSIPVDAIGYWSDRLRQLGVDHQSATRRLDEEVLTVLDPDGLMLELVARGSEDGREPWLDGPIPPAHAIRGFSGVTLEQRALAPTASLLKDVLGFSIVASSGSRMRLAAHDAGRASVVDVVERDDAPAGLVAAGTVHHVAWRVPDDDAQASWRPRLVEAGVGVTPVQDRCYFRSIYFREPGGVLFEIATDGPGFAVDETLERLGEELRLPPWLEPQRERIVRTLPPLSPNVASRA